MMATGSVRALRNFSFSGLKPVLAGLVVLFILQHPAHAEVWGYMDGQGVAHFAAQRLDARYTLFFRAGESFDTRDGLPLSGSARRAGTASAASTSLLAFFDTSPKYKQVRRRLQDASSANHIDYELLRALVATESGFDAQAVSPKGAVGLMQVMPETAQRYGLQGDRGTPIEKQLADPDTNIRIGARYLHDLIHLFPGQLELALAAYNAGAGAVQRAGNKIPNYLETRNYVDTVMQLYNHLKPDGMRAVPGARVHVEMMGGPVALADQD
ncbi:MAG: lytic transglycosylase domain-containing protein [Rhodoferax sp.]|nr:lytic transglycosylase domain-containing protein [Rhodoferax sp.]